MTTSDAPQDSVPAQPPAGPTGPFPPTTAPGGYAPTPPGGYAPTPPGGAYPGPTYPAPASAAPTYPAPSYPPTQAYPPVAYAPVPPTNGLAVASLICSIAGLMTGVTAIAGIVCGHIALNQIKQTGEEGRGLAVAGVAVGYAVVALYALVIVGWLLFTAVIIAAAPTGT